MTQSKPAQQWAKEIRNALATSGQCHIKVRISTNIAQFYPIKSTDQVLTHPNAPEGALMIRRNSLDEAGNQLSICFSFIEGNILDIDPT